MRNIFLSLFFLFYFSASSQLKSQQGNFTPATSGNRYYRDADLPVVKDKYPKFADGTPYFLEDWIEGDILLATGETFHHVKMRLDLVEQSLQYVNDKGIEVVA